MNKKVVSSKTSLGTWLFELSQGKSADGDKIDEIHLFPAGTKFRISDKGKIQTAVFAGTQPKQEPDGQFSFEHSGILYVSTSTDDNKPRYRRLFVSGLKVNIRPEHLGRVHDWTQLTGVTSTPPAIPETPRRLILSETNG